MRTTLKRGMGRGAAVNGNGRAVLPPTAVSPVTPLPAAAAAAAQPLAPRRPGRLAGSSSGAAHARGRPRAAASTSSATRRVEDRPGVTTPEVKVAQKRLAVPDGREARDRAGDRLRPPLHGRRGRPGARARTRSCSSAPTRRTKSISMMSFPRDLVVDIHCPGAPTHRGRINQAFTECGPKGTLETVKAATGLPINYLITVNFRGFIKIVDRLGGVWIDVDRRYFNDSGEYSAINLQPGYQELNGYQALAYVRYRHTDSDIYRIGAAAGVRARVQGPGALGLQAAEAARARQGDHAQRRGRSSAAARRSISTTVLSYAFFAYDLPPGHFFQSKHRRAWRRTRLQHLRVRRSSMRERRAAVREPGRRLAARRRPRSRSAGSRSRRRPPPRDTYVTVLNGNGVDGSATLAGGLLHERGYSIVDAVERHGERARRTTTSRRRSTTTRRSAARRRRRGRSRTCSARPTSPKRRRRSSRSATTRCSWSWSARPSTAASRAAPVDQTPVRQAPSVAQGHATPRCSSCATGRRRCRSR